MSRWVWIAAAVIVLLVIAWMAGLFGAETAPPPAEPAATTAPMTAPEPTAPAVENPTTPGAEPPASEAPSPMSPAPAPQQSNP
ncbi:dynamin [Amaricoccus solimangrovi]|uniref:Dynamin n=1 Tax=Amaricoccus solimangrovi TaxID=2589815 RepID=A0A501WN10_9RHOB|nr:dynamin [Amaricoccus solimangrovi]TPE49730.1 dynamin [Amaricoccus solimangrovi]